MAEKKTEKKTEKPAKAEAAKAAKPAKAKPAIKADSKFATFLASKKIDPRRVMTTSHGLETLQKADRDIKLVRRRARGAEGEAAKKETAKPRSGRAITQRAINAALTGGPLSGPTKSRILRAVNHLLDQKKAEKVDLRALF